MDRARTSSIDINIIRAKGRDFELKFVLDHDDYSELGADRIGARKNFLHDFRSRVGCDVDVLRRFAANQITNAAAGEIGDMTFVPVSAPQFGALFFPLATWLSW